MAAVLPCRLSIDRKSLTAAGAGNLPNCPAVNLIQMGVPPFIPALVRTEFFLFPAYMLHDRRSAAQAAVFSLMQICLFCFHLPRVPAAEGFHCIFRYSDFPGDCAVAHALCPERGYDHSLFVRHRRPSNR
jgi:hypothetical protein